MKLDQVRPFQNKHVIFEVYDKNVNLPDTKKLGNGFGLLLGFSDNEKFVALGNDWFPIDNIIIVDTCDKVIHTENEKQLLMEKKVKV